MEVRAARRQSRRLERRFRLSRLAIDKEILMTSRDNLRRLIASTKVSYLNTKISESVAKKSLFGIVDSFLLKKNRPPAPATWLLAWAAWAVRQSLRKEDSKHQEFTGCGGVGSLSRSSMPSSTVVSFSLVTTDEIVSLVKSCPTKSSPRDPIPTFLLKKLLYVLAPPITNIVNMSLSSGVFPDEMKLA